MDLNGKRVLVVGLGRSGVASALFLKSRGARVTVSDAKSEDQLRKEIPALLDHGIAVETGGHGERTFQNQDLIVVTTGLQQFPWFHKRHRKRSLCLRFPASNWKPFVTSGPRLQLS